MGSFHALSLPSHVKWIHAAWWAQRCLGFSNGLHFETEMPRLRSWRFGMHLQYLFKEYWKPLWRRHSAIRYCKTFHHPFGDFRAARIKAICFSSLLWKRSPWKVQLNFPTKLLFKKAFTGLVKLLKAVNQMFNSSGRNGEEFSCLPS